MHILPHDHLQSKFSWQPPGAQCSVVPGLPVTQTDRKSRAGGRTMPVDSLLITTWNQKKQEARCSQAMLSSNQVVVDRQCTARCLKVDVGRVGRGIHFSTLSRARPSTQTLSYRHIYLIPRSPSVIWIHTFRTCKMGLDWIRETMCLLGSVCCCLDWMHLAGWLEATTAAMRRSVQDGTEYDDKIWKSFCLADIVFLSYHRQRYKASDSGSQPALQNCIFKSFDLHAEFVLCVCVCVVLERACECWHELCMSFEMIWFCVFLPVDKVVASLHFYPGAVFLFFLWQ